MRPESELEDRVCGSERVSANYDNHVQRLVKLSDLDQAFQGLLDRGSIAVISESDSNSSSIQLQISTLIQN